MNIKTLRSFLILCAGLVVTVSLSITPTVASANSIIGVYDAPTNPVGATLTPDNRELWVPSYSGKSINVYDATTMSLVRTINSTALSDFSPIAVAFSPDGSIAYVTSEDELLFLSTVTGLSIAPVLRMPSGSSVQNFAVSENGHLLYMPSSFQNKIFVYDITNIQSIPAPVQISTVVHPTFVSISSSKNLGVVSGKDGMQFFSLLSNQILLAPALLEINAYPSNPVFSPDGNFVFITWNGLELRKIDSFQRSLFADENLPSDCVSICNGLSITPNGEQIWSSNSITSGFNIFSSESLLEISELNPPQPLISQTSRIPAINSSGSKIYLLSVLAQKIVVASINPAQGNIPAPTPTPTPTQEELAQTGNSVDAIGISTLFLVFGTGLFAMGMLSRKKKHVH